MNESSASRPTAAKAFPYLTRQARMVRRNEFLVAAPGFGLEVHVLNVSRESDFDQILAKLMQLKASALVISGGLFFVSHREQLAALTLRHAMPAVFPYREFARAGGPLSYGSDISDSYRADTRLHCEMSANEPKRTCHGYPRREIVDLIYSFL